MTEIQKIEVNGIRVLTTKQLAEAYETTEDKIRWNFKYNRKKYVQGKHFIIIEGDELREMKSKCEFHTLFKQAKSVCFWTEKGALLHAKSLNTDKAWEVYDYLVDFYFRTKEHQEKRAEEPKPQGKQVVDIPVNRKAQDMMTELRKNMAALDVLLGTLDRYSPEEDYQKVVYVIRQQGMNIANLSINLATIKPSMIYKVY